MQSIAYIPGSDASGNASLMTVQNVRSPGATTILVNTVSGAPTKFYGSYGTPHTFTDPVTGETITVISEATAVDFAGHIDGSNVEIDEIAPGYTDNGNEVGDIIVIRPVTEWANNIFNTLSVAHNDDGTLKENSVSTLTVEDGAIIPTKLDFSAIETYENPGSGGGTFYYVNLGGLKLLWGKTDRLTSTATQYGLTLTLPVDFFDTILNAQISGEDQITTNSLFPQIAVKSTTQISYNVVHLNTANGGCYNNIFVIGT